MKRMMHTALMTVIAAQVLLIGQGSDVARVLADVRKALGGEDKLAAVKTLTAEGTLTRPLPDGTSRASQFEMAMALPDRYMRKDVIGMINGAGISRTSGFNGDAVIEITDMPPQFGGMHTVLMRPGGPAPGGAPLTPGQEQQRHAEAMQSARREFARLALGMFGAQFAVYPLEFSHAGQAESPDGKADVLEVRHTDGFVAKLFVDAGTRLPLMLSWMDREPLPMTPVTMQRGGTVSAGGGGGAQVMRGESRGAVSPEEMQRFAREQEERLKEAEARRKVVEYRLFYGEYKAVDGVRLPTRLQRTIAGQPVDEIGLERIRINPRLDAKTFAPAGNGRPDAR